MGQRRFSGTAQDSTFPARRRGFPDLYATAPVLCRPVGLGKKPEVIWGAVFPSKKCLNIERNAAEHFRFFFIEDTVHHRRCRCLAGGRRRRLISGGSAIAFGGLENSGLGDSGREGRCEGGGLYVRRVQQQQATGGGLIVCGRSFGDGREGGLPLSESRSERDGRWGRGYVARGSTGLFDGAY